MAVAVLITAIVGLVGFGLQSIHGQQGSLRLERYANDALEVLQLTGTMDTIVNYIRHGYLENAETLAETELRKILPAEIQFRMIIGDENDPRLDNIFPTAGKNEEWLAAFQKAGEIAKAVRTTTLPQKNLKILAWVDNDDEEFISLLLVNAGIEIKKVNTLADFWNEIDAAIVNWQPNRPCYDAVFIPDAETDLAPNGLASKIIELVTYQKCDGMLVVGGSTLYHNCQLEETDGYLWESLGVQWNNSPQEISGPPLDNMRIISSSNFVTQSYKNGDNIEYNPNYSQYIYMPIDNSWVIARWDDAPNNLTAPLSGIIVRPAGYFHSRIGTLPKPAVLFNMRFAQSATDPDNPMGTADWITLIKFALGYEETTELISLYVWRGQTV
ncbi:MAG: hypothetical protein ACP5PX_05230 [Candidatus Hadarchaeum sp.]|uniref:hypothetical protein n=1 Tax=Candidatus Hadarchaeum sp. TaxID=2883567 RepID=UPI003D0CB51A